MRTAIEVPHQPLESFVVPVAAGRVFAIGSVERGVEIQRWTVVDGRVQVRVEFAVLAVGRRVAYADFDRAVDIETCVAERYVVLGFREAINPCAETGDCFGAFGEGERPFVDPLAVEAVH